MAEKTSGKKKLDLTGLQKVWIAGALLFFGVNIVLMCIFGLNSLLFTGNEHFTLREIVITPPPGYMYSYWNNEEQREKRIRMIREELFLSPGRTNLFELNPGEMRTTMLQKHPEIRNIEIRKVYPDRLEFTIQETSPFLSIGNRRCLDDRGKVVGIEYFRELGLPLFLDNSDEVLKNVKPGEEYHSKPAEFAISLVKLLQEKYPQIGLARIEHKDLYMDCLVKFGNYTFRVFLPYPVRPEEDLYRNKIPQLYDRLQALHQKKQYSVLIDLRFKDPVIKDNNPAPIKK